MLRLFTTFCMTPWALDQVTLDVLGSVLLRWSSGERFTPEQVHAAVGDAPQLAARRAERAVAAGGGAVQVIPVYGVLAHRIHQVGNTSQPLTSVERLSQQVRAAQADPAVSNIVLDVDSPGGSAFGVQELGDVIHEAAQIKPVTAVVNSMAASGGYWIASQATEIVITPSGMGGGIGVITSHIDASAAYEKLGVKKTFITAGKYKAEGNDTGPLSEEARESVQDMVDKFYGAFVKAVARGRNVGVDVVRGPAFGEGRVKLAKEAVESGMADRIDTLDNTISRLAKGRGRSGGATAHLQTLHRRTGMTARLADIEISLLEL